MLLHQQVPCHDTTRFDPEHYFEIRSRHCYLATVAITEEYPPVALINEWQVKESRETLRHGPHRDIDGVSRKDEGSFQGLWRCSAYWI
jgi:hypothetical protein